MRILFLAVVCVWAAGCGASAETLPSGNGGAGGVATSSSSSASSAASSSGGEPPCKIGGQQCAGFSECCSGTCSNFICTQCNSDGDWCGVDGCCTGLQCYNGECMHCGYDKAPCNGSADCCSGTCSLGKCAPVKCNPGETPCGTTCKDLAADEAHCGACGVECVGDMDCCGGKCADTLSDPANCGACGTACSANETCVNGACKINAACCGDGLNIAVQPASPLMHMHEVVFPFTPTCGMLLTRIDLFTTSGRVAIAADVDGLPGGEIAEAQLTMPLPNGWLGSDPMLVQLNAGNQYWIVQDNGDQAANSSLAPGGIVFPTYYAPKKNGPYSFNGNAPMTARLIGDCNP